MRGYVQNESNQAYFIVQRQIPPGGKVELTEIYKSVGKQSGLEEDWAFYDHFGKPFGAKKTAKKKTNEALQKETTSSTTSSKKSKDAAGAGRTLRRDSSAVTKGAKITPATIIDAPYDQARTLIEKCTDKTVLKKSLALTKHFAKKEQHMRHIIKRLEQVY
jgi:hypothetical protein